MLPAFMELELTQHTIPVLFGSYGSLWGCGIDPKATQMKGTKEPTQC